MGLEEFTFLEKKLNGENKQALFKDVNDDTKVVRNKEDMKNLVLGKSKEADFRDLKPNEQARIVVQRLRQMIGTLQYMQDKEVKAIWVKEKNRMGAIIKFIDENLPKTPRVIKGRGTPERTLGSWKPQDLGDKWDKYMDKVFDKAKERATDLVEGNLEDLKKEWDSQKKRGEYKADANDDQKKKDEKKALEKIHKDVLDIIKKCSDAWDKVKDWKNPWKNDGLTDPAQ
ncbi:hypothetical protein BU26DRAFT_585367 [Trematosphaeria pertusa]|uniref:Uncharacterized protein n=1 Tax=Trematosphaeria pertusa TaxID=390896 RepID=A0A6A6HUW7_9PLEO|nr:uncharacterized protein BU26DRAFT_585367 [Trematosphaeria pertusa]KAF2241817.1 hypothetical protein BU26DRAFT_585367 [Trematosphaeria pertusa]